MCSNRKKNTAVSLVVVQFQRSKKLSSLTLKAKAYICSALKIVSGHSNLFLRI